jgi:1,4-dihydroxy-2-naphthoyl-CoA synthase
MHYETIKYEKQAAYCLITLNKPERTNAMRGVLGERTLASTFLGLSFV